MSSPVKNSKNTESIFIFNKIEVEEKKENDETEKNDETDESEVNEDEFTCEECSTVQGLNNCELCDKENECEECYGQGGDYGPNEIWVCNTCLPICNECEKKLYTSYDKCCGKGRSERGATSAHGGGRIPHACRRAVVVACSCPQHGRCFPSKCRYGPTPRGTGLWGRLCQPASWS